MEAVSNYITQLHYILPLQYTLQLIFVSLHNHTVLFARTVGKFYCPEYMKVMCI